MASRIIRPFERASVDFSGLTSGRTSTIYLARRINVAAFKEVTAYVRFHSGTSVTVTPSTSKIHFNADGFTDEDPGANDSGGAPAFQTLVVDADLQSAPAVTTGGVMRVVAVPAPFGSLLSISWTVTSSGTGTILYVTSIDLVCKEF